jgi:hypothetical protein
VDEDPVRGGRRFRPGPRREDDAAGIVEVGEIGDDVLQRPAAGRRISGRDDLLKRVALRRRGLRRQQRSHRREDQREALRHHHA